MNTHIQRWNRLCKKHLPISVRDSIWRYSRLPAPTDPDQGWKLHISATVLTANRALAKIGGLLSERSVLFKAPHSLVELSRLNSGIYYGYSQVGKCFTIYPQNDEEAVQLAQALSARLHKIPGPRIPFDYQYAPNSPIYYRFGSFKAEVNGHSGRLIKDPADNLVEDAREADAPPWATNPFPRTEEDNLSPNSQSNFRIFRALTKRGKGGVYLAVDLGKDLEMCVLKEGRKHGEVSWDGRDGYWRIKQEEKILNCLTECKVPVPGVLSSFETNTRFFLAIEHIEGITLKQLLERRMRRVSIMTALELSHQVALIVASIHQAGWVWRDCKPSNLVVTKAGGLRPIDFEGACRINDPNPVDWGSKPFASPSLKINGNERSQPSVDLYAMGVVFYYLLTGQYPEQNGCAPIQKLRRKVPASIIDVVNSLLSANANERPSARSVANTLSRVKVSG